MSWVASSLSESSEKRFTAELPLVGVLFSLRPLLKELGGGFKEIYVQKQAVSAANTDANRKLLTTVYQFQCFQTKANLTQVHMPLYGTSQVYVGIDGKEIIGGIRTKPISDGIPLKKQFEEGESMSGAELVKKCESPENWLLQLEKGDVAYIPSGYIMVSFSPQGSTVLRRCVSPKHEDAAVVAAIMQVLEAYPELRESTWAQWLGFLKTDQE